MTLSVLKFDDYDLDRFLPVAAGFGQEHYGFVVTPNADHLIRLDESPEFCELYERARYVLLDSRFISHLVVAGGGTRLPVCAGSDLTARLFSDIIKPDDKLVLIGARAEQAEQLRARYGLRGLQHYNPPMGFIRNPEAVEDCLKFIESHSPFRFCFLAVGSPQQEIVARHLGERAQARGLALCIGASIDFITGAEQRAPLWLQKLGLEWLFRLMQSPKRLGKRYLVRGPRVFGLLRRTRIELRPISR